MESKCIDINEEHIYENDSKLLSLLLMDHSTGLNIRWACNDYSSYGFNYGKSHEITLDSIIGKHDKMIRPRILKNEAVQVDRTRENAEVFTPTWICNAQINLIDKEWFGRNDVFNIETEKGWVNSANKINFPNVRGKTWQDYVDLRRMEITCGEAPYLTSRYDMGTGFSIPVENRIGFLDRKLRVISENTINETEWLTWAFRALESIYGYDYQGDNVLLARENLLCTFSEYFEIKFNRELESKQIRKAAGIISWNIWQMDGIKMTAPFSESKPLLYQVSFFDSPENDSIKTEIDCKIKDWRSGKSLLFRELIKE